MKRRSRLVLVALVLSTFVQSPVAAREPGTYFTVKTEGVPVTPPWQNVWETDQEQDEALLRFSGAHAVGTRTVIEAGWLSSWTSAGSPPELSTSYALTNENQIGEDIVVIESYRMREKGRRWGPWASDRLVLEPGSISAGGYMSLGFLSTGRTKWRPMQLDWKVEIVIEGPTYLEGSYSIEFK